MMKKNEKRKNSTMKKLIPAAGMLALSASMLATSTYAWFTMNREVSVTGMSMKTVVDSNLLIDNFAQTEGGSWTTGNWATDDSTFTNSEIQTISTKNIIVPLSTIDAKNFYFTNPDNVNGDGDAISEAYTKLTGSSANATADITAIQTKYPSATGSYLDYHFVLKATNTAATAQKIVLTQLDMTCSGETTFADTDKAWRVAVFANKFTTATVNGAKTAPGLPENVTHIYTPSGATNFSDAEGTHKAVNATNGVDTVTYASAAGDSEIATVAANATEYYDVTVRVWLEGEDTTCKVETFNGLANGNWALATKYKLQADTTGGVYNINMIDETTRPDVGD